MASPAQIAVAACPPPLPLLRGAMLLLLTAMTPETIFMLYEGVAIHRRGACVGNIMIHGRNVHITKTKYDIHPKELSFQSLALFS